MNLATVVLLGPPGSGKSTQAAKIANSYPIPTISAGALLRQTVKDGTDLGRQVEEFLKRGELAPNHLVDRLVFDRLGQPDCEKGFILDGFPRTLEQAESLDKFMKRQSKRIEEVIYLQVPDAVIIARLSARRVCPVCGAVYNLVFDRPRPEESCYACHTPLRYVAGVLQCEGCGVPFVLREDDRPDVIRRRLQVQRRTLQPVLAHYRALGLLSEVDAARPYKDVFDAIRAVLGRQQRQAGGTS